MVFRNIMFWTASVIFIAGILTATESWISRPPSRNPLDFQYDSSWSGRPLTSSESTTVRQAIDSIRTPPPDSITYTDAAGNTLTVSCSTLANALQGQLESGTMEAETLNDDYAGGEYWDEININDDVLADAGSSGNTDYLEELLVHEGTHKGQSNSLPETDTEIPAYGAELAYKDSIGLDSTDADYRFTRDKLREYRRIHTYNALKKMLESSWLTSWVVRYLPKDPPENWQLAAFQPGDSQEILFDLGPLEVSDMHGFEDYFAPGISLLMFAGAHRDGGSHLTAAMIDHGQVVQPFPFWQMRYPPGLYSFAYSEQMHCYFFVDTLMKFIIVAPDMDGNKLPDGPTPLWATAMQFPEITDMLSVTPTNHPQHGFGLLVNDCDAHFSRWIPAYAERPFLKDLGGPEGADVSFMCRRFEFVNIKPRITEPWPWQGDMQCTVFGTWTHPVEVWTTDPSGEILIEPLGVAVLADDIVGQCPLLRPLLAGERIVAVDPISGKRLRTAYQVPEPIPRELTIRYMESGELRLDWMDVVGAASYGIEVSFDGYVWEDPGLSTQESEITLPLLHLNLTMFRVVARR